MIPWIEPSLGEQERKYAIKALESTWISGGSYVDEFERMFSELHGNRFALTAANGTAALHMAYLAAGIGRGDEVIIPNYTFAAPAAMAIAVGATPVLVDVDPNTFCVDSNAARKAITKKTKAIVAVHLYGASCEMDALGDLAKSQKLLLIEDCAESVFTKYRGRHVGSFGDISIFSFQSAKTITTGEGGMVLTANESYMDHMRLLRNHGMSPDRKYWHHVVGYNYRLTNVQAAIGVAQTERHEELVQKRKQVFSWYKEHIRFPGVSFQHYPEHVDAAYWTLPLKINEKEFGSSVEAITTKLLKDGIETRNAFYPLSEMPALATPSVAAANLENSLTLSKTIFSLPFYPSLTKEQVQFISQRLGSTRG